MFSCIASGTFKALVKVLQTSTDGFLVLKALQGIYRFATIAHYYQMGDRLNSSLVALLEVTSKWLKELDMTSQTVDIPRACFLKDLARRKDVSYPWQAGEGAAQHMGIVSLHTALEVVKYRQYYSAVLHYINIKYIFSTSFIQTFNYKKKKKKRLWLTLDH
jgi:hypothetical protein